jgi:hypothetical protein
LLAGSVVVSFCVLGVVDWLLLEQPGVKNEVTVGWIYYNNGLFDVVSAGGQKTWYVWMKQTI